MHGEKQHSAMEKSNREAKYLKGQIESVNRRLADNNRNGVKFSAKAQTTIDKLRLKNYNLILSIEKINTHPLENFEAFNSTANFPFTFTTNREQLPRFWRANLSRVRSFRI